MVAVSYMFGKMGKQSWNSGLGCEIVYQVFRLPQDLGNVSWVLGWFDELTGGATLAVYFLRRVVASSVGRSRAAENFGGILPSAGRCKLRW